MIRLRGHHLLCLQGFRGLGYDAASTARLQQLFDRVSADPATPVLIVDGPDAICDACPHLGSPGGTGDALPGRPACLRVPGADDAVRLHDRAVLAALGLAPGEETSLAEVRARLADADTRAAALAPCAGCPWAAVCLLLERLPQLSGRGGGTDPRGGG